MLRWGLLVLFLAQCWASTCSVQDHGAKGDGKTLDTKAINDAINSCNTVTFPPGIYLSGTIQLKSNRTLQILEGSTILSAPGDVNAFLHPDKNTWDQYQDYGHSHWKDSLFYGADLTDVTIEGNGVIDGSSLESEQPKHMGGGCRMFGIKSSHGLTFRDLTLKGGGWFVMLLTGCEDVVITDLTVTPKRDGFDIVGCSRVTIERTSIIGGGDDAIAIKSDFSLGRVLHSRDFFISDSTVGCGCNGMQFGSETVGDFTNVTFKNIVVTYTGKAGIGIVSMDGSTISDVTYENITMTHTTTPIYMYIGARSRRPAPKVFGSIHDITISNVVATNCQGPRGNWTATIDGQPKNMDAGASKDYNIGPGIKLSNITITYMGGGQESDANIYPPHPSVNYPPRYLGTRPAYGYFIRHATGVELADVHVDFQENDYRPAFMIFHSSNITIGADVTASRKGPYDVGYKQSTLSVLNKNFIVKDLH